MPLDLHIAMVIFVSLVLATGARKGDCMNKKTNDAIVEGSFGRLKEVDNFLPSPEKLVF